MAPWPPYPSLWLLTAHDYLVKALETSPRQVFVSRMSEQPRGCSGVKIILVTLSKLTSEIFFSDRLSTIVSAHVTSHLAQLMTPPAISCCSHSYNNTTAAASAILADPRLTAHPKILAPRRAAHGRMKIGPDRPTTQCRCCLRVRGS